MFHRGAATTPCSKAWAKEIIKLKIKGNGKRPERERKRDKEREMCSEWVVVVVVDEKGETRRESPPHIFVDCAANSSPVNDLITFVT